MSITRGRVRWHCRRALLELDLVFERYLANGFAELADSELDNFAEFLLLDDYELWALVNGSKKSDNPRFQCFVVKLGTPPRVA